MVLELAEPLEGGEVDLLEHIIGIGAGGQAEPHETLNRPTLLGKQSLKFLHCVTSFGCDVKPVSSIIDEKETKKVHFQKIFMKLPSAVAQGGES